MAERADILCVASNAETDSLTTEAINFAKVRAA